MTLLSVKFVGSESLPGARTCNLVLRMVLRLELLPMGSGGLLQLVMIHQEGALEYSGLVV